MSDLQKDPKADQKQKPDGKGPDGLSQEELTVRGGENSSYLDQTRITTDHLPLGAQGDGIASSVLNSAVYPKDTKPEILHTQDEKAGADYPGGPRAGEVPDRSQRSEDIEREYRRTRSYLPPVPDSKPVAGASTGPVPVRAAPAAVPPAAHPHDKH